MVSPSMGQIKMDSVGGVSGPELRQAIAFRKDGSYLPCCAKSDFSSLCGTWAYCSSGPPQRGHCGIDAMSSQDETGMLKP